MPQPNVNHAGVTIVIHKSKEVMQHTSCFCLYKNLFVHVQQVFFLSSLYGMMLVNVLNTK